MVIFKTVMRQQANHHSAHVVAARKRYSDWMLYPTGTHIKQAIVSKWAITMQIMKHLKQTSKIRPYCGCPPVTYQRGCEVITVVSR